MKNHTLLMKIEKQNCEHLEKSQVRWDPQVGAMPRGPQLFKVEAMLTSAQASSGIKRCPGQPSPPISQHLLLSILIFRMKQPDVDLHPLIQGRTESKKMNAWKKLASKK